MCAANPAGEWATYNRDSDLPAVAPFSAAGAVIHCEKIRLPFRRVSLGAATAGAGVSFVLGLLIGHARVRAPEEMVVYLAAVCAGSPPTELDVTQKSTCSSTHMHGVTSAATQLTSFWLAAAGGLLLL